jgi:CDP-6-deoxy-D-xylo-4-hexulose-3-dehydrase
MNLEEAIKEIKEIVEKYFKSNPPFEMNDNISLISPSYNEDEVIEAIESLLSTYVTMGEKVYEFEKKFAKYLGINFGTMVNSGSSANLIALEILANPVLRNKIKPGDEIITPALTWSTTVFPILDIHAVPVFVDSFSDSLTLNTEQLDQALSDKSKAIMPVHLLGYPCDMDYIRDFAEDHDLFVIEDCCEAHGAEWKGQKVGSFGDLGTYSFFFSHHISTIEGGMVVTNNELYNNLSKSLRAHGWVRERPDQDEFLTNYPEIDSRFLFVNKGYNLRPTEIQGAFGIHQIDKLETFLRIRKENAQFWLDNLQEVTDYIKLPIVEKNIRHAWFGFPLIIKDNAPFKRSDITSFLEKNNIETRPVMAGNITKQPALKYFKWRKVGNLEVSTEIMKNAFFFGNHPGIDETKREKISNLIKDFISSFS